MNKLVIAVSLLIPVLASPALAEPSQLYGGITYSSIEDDGDVELSSIGGRFGTFINDNFSVEMRLQTGLDDHEDYDEFLDVDLTVEADTIYGLYGRLGFYATPSIYPYAIIGYSKFNYDVTLEDGSFSVSGSDSESSISFGFGTDVTLSNSASISLEFLRLIDENDFEIEALTAGILFKF